MLTNEVMIRSVQEALWHLIVVVVEGMEGHMHPGLVLF